MERKNSFLEKYNLETREKIVKLVMHEKVSYREIERKYKVPRNTAFNWVKKYKERGSVKPASGINLKDTIDYKEQYEILKKFQAFLKEQQEKK